MTPPIPQIMTAPPPDLELGTVREPVQYLLNVPPQGIGENTGLIFYIHGYGYRFNDSYAEKLATYLSENYDCVVARVDFHGAICHSGGIIKPAPDFFSILKNHHGIIVPSEQEETTENRLSIAFNEMKKNGINRFPSDCILIKYSQYMSFGLLPALDHIQVTNFILKNFKINTSRLFLLGSSYGGYISLFINKIAPKSFRMIAENSGFSTSEDTPLSIFGEMSGAIDNIKCYFKNNMSFSKDEKSQNYYKPAFAEIRELRNPDHYWPSKTSIYSFHSYFDTIASYERKAELMDLLSEFRPVTFTSIGPDQIDGRIFKTTEHAMRASLRGIFDIAYQAWLPRSHEAEAITDFDLGSRYCFPCGDLTYTVTYDWEHGVRLALTETT